MKRLLALLLLLFSLSAKSQELFPNTEPASTIGKNVLGLKGLWETYNENGRQRSEFSLRILYGATKNLTLFLQPIISNHHGEYLPSDFVSHSHNSNGQIINYTPPKVFGIKYPFEFGGLYCFAKYRFLSIDGERKHFRMAAFGEYSSTSVAHDEAEPNLHGDTGGFGTGIIATQLLHRFAASITIGATLPNDYHEERPLSDTDAVVITDVSYGNSFNYSLSLGYLLLPKEYKNYEQTNYNAYLELIGKSYEGAYVVQNEIPAEIENITLASGHYLDAHLGIQAIINSNTRIDLTAGFPLIQRSWDHFYPIYNIGLQHNLFFGKKKLPVKKY